MAQIIDGKSIAATIKSELQIESAAFISRTGTIPHLALLLVGDDPASQVYVRSKAKTCEEIGFRSTILNLPATTSQEEVLDVIHSWNGNKLIHGILVQLPLPRHISEHKIIETISPSKDVDGLHPENMGRLVLGLPGFVPCTPAGIIELLSRSGISAQGKHAVVVGRSNIVGKPIANLLYQKSPQANAVVTICHTGASGTLRDFTRQADILVAAIGVANRITADYVKEGVAVIDVGINRITDVAKKTGYRIVGDVDFESVLPKVSAITPVPGGVGPMTIVMLMRNTLEAAHRFTRNATINR
ncbi:bifunctional methylenetetrahydrofolate dehydrogenase/methenyltetrahydrofolate cyclohydrolase FolD [Ignavibacteria bacterium]|nr:bifunctional 5,10-methylenetetrahydrofolate dehydrogenase/5,10-methenyltetrahydrofolate cyclohydrolase [Bacteroidota bacterium]MCZ2132971.1 bifunctional 5,10-methylenetetrahydrofolate dehydrogenase/5,10-methenyltetrahydrofolate cyclohydrolase [Bacteroidota bacterium]